ncbi:MAG: hypothetical protein EXS08_06050 [Planctomycetes bacterium]|nr:hypothetical protein [Planctomycetota bacterium]
MNRARLPWIVPLALAGCACREEPPPPSAAEALHLLARRPDLVVEQPAVIAPVGDIAGFGTWGVSEGPGWSQKMFTLPQGVAYRETNQATASLILPATRPVARELVLGLWCSRPVGAEPAKIDVLLNGEVLHAGLALAATPVAPLTLHAPQEFWRRGENELTLRTPLCTEPAPPTWDTLALTHVAYGPEARVTLDVAAEAARFAAGTGARYALALSSPATLSFAGAASGAGELILRLGTLNPRNGECSLDSEPAPRFASEGGELRGTLQLAPRSGALRVLELEWLAPGGAELALTRLEATESSPAPRPPIVFVSIDTFAARNLSLYGYGRATSPELERLAQDAVVFEHCLTNAPWTLPSYLSVMTGLYPRAHWLELDGAEVTLFDRWQLAENRLTLAEALRARGYRTGGFVDTQWLSPIFQFPQGFDVYNGDGAMASFADPTKHIQAIVRRLVPPWLDAGRANSPPFLFLHALDAHGPYLPDAPFRDSFSGALADPRTLIPAGSNNETYRTMPEWMGRTFVPDQKLPLPEELPLEDTVARYDETILKVDHYLGELFAALKRRGLYDSAVIVVTGDHGEHFGPEAYGHGVMHEDVLHVPLIVKLPGNAHGGTRVARGVSLVDLYPTLVELAGGDTRGGYLQGSSLLARLAPAAADDEPVLYSEGGHIEQYALTQGCWRLVEERPGSESSESSLLTHPRVPDEWYRLNAPELLTRPLSLELLNQLLARPGFQERIAELRQLVAGPYYALYDLCHDPEQRDDRKAAEPERMTRMGVRLEAEKQRSRSARKDADPSLLRPPLSDEARQRLHDLGYGGEKKN